MTINKLYTKTYDILKLKGHKFEQISKTEKTKPKFTYVTTNKKMGQND